MPLVKQVWREPSGSKHNKMKIKIAENKTTINEKQKPLRAKIGCTFTGYILNLLHFADLLAILSLQISKVLDFRKTLIRRIKPYLKKTPYRLVLLLNC